MSQSPFTIPEDLLNGDAGSAAPPVASRQAEKDNGSSSGDAVPSLPDPERPRGVLRRIMGLGRPMGAAVDPAKAGSSKATGSGNCPPWLEKIDFTSRFATKEAVQAALKRFTPLHGGHEAKAELAEVEKICARTLPVPVYEHILTSSGRAPEDIVKWVRATTLHVDSCPAVMPWKGSERPFTPLETLYTGIGQCTNFASLAAALIETAGVPARLWGVPGHTFLEWRRPGGGWQLEDVDVMPSDAPLPRGLSMRSILESYPDWKPILIAVPTLNCNAQDRCFVPAGQDVLVGWRHRLAEPTQYEVQTTYEVAMVEPQDRRMSLQVVDDEGRAAALLVDNDNPEPQVLLLCDMPFDAEARVSFDDNGTQHDVFAFARAKDRYDAFIDGCRQRFYATIPARAKAHRVPLDGLETMAASAFSLSPDQIKPHPYLLADRLNFISTPKARPSPDPKPEPSAAIRAAEAVFQDLCKNGGEKITKAAINYAIGSTPERALVDVTGYGLPAFTGRVLDAGTGTGGHGIVLAETASSIAAVDYTAERVHFLEAALERLDPRPNIEARVASIEELPYGDDEFDNVYCRGVIFITNVQRTLGEFHRVLKPGGQVYLDLNADGWNLQLVHERGKTNPDAIRQGRDTLYNTAWRRYAGPAIARLKESIEANGLQLDLANTDLELGALLDEIARHLCAMSPRDAAVVRALELRSRILCGESHTAVILRDMLAASAGQQAGPSVTVGSESWAPEEIEAMATKIGFTDFRWWSGATSLQQPGKRPMELGPMIETVNTAREHYHGQLSVWHALFRKS